MDRTSTPASSVSPRKRAEAALVLLAALAALWPARDGGLGGSDSAALCALGGARAEAPDCATCHSRRAKELALGPHGRRNVHCLYCHAGAEAHEASLGESPAPNPKTFTQEALVELCARCHKLDEEDFACAERLTSATPRSCRACHEFHGFPSAMADVKRTGASHGVALPADRATPGPTETYVEGSVELGVRVVSGNSRQYRSDVGREPGAQLLGARVRVEDRDPAAAIDHLAAEVRGIGDPYSFGKLEAGKHGSFEFRASGSRSEDRFDPTTPLHDAFTVRGLGTAELEVDLDDGVTLTLGYDRLERREDRTLSRYREISNEAFEPVDGDRRATADLGRVRLDWVGDGFDAHLVQTLRFWRQDDDRFFRDPNMVLDDFEGFESESDAVTATTRVFGGTDLLDGDLRLDVEVLFSYSKRDFDVFSAAAGLNADALTYASTLDADGAARGAYGRVEVGLAYLVLEDTEIALDLRYRHDDERSDLEMVEAVTAPLGGGTAIAVEDVTSKAVDQTFDIEIPVRHRPFDWLSFGIGYGGRFEWIDVGGPRARNEDPTDHGIIADVDARPCEEVRIRGRLRAFTADDPYTSITPERQALAELDLSVRLFEKLHGVVRPSLRRTRLSAPGSRSDVEAASFLLRWAGETDDFFASVGWSYSNYRVEVESIAQVGGFPAPYEAEFAGHASTWSFLASARLADVLRVTGGADVADTYGDNRSSFFRGFGEIEVVVRSDLFARARVTRYEFDGTESDRDDFDATVLELSFEYRF